MVGSFLFWVFVCHFLSFLICLFCCRGFAYFFIHPVRATPIVAFITLSSSLSSYSSCFLASLFVRPFAFFASYLFQAFASCLCFTSCCPSVDTPTSFLCFKLFLVTFFVHWPSPRTYILAVYTVQHRFSPLPYLASSVLRPRQGFCILRRAVIYSMLHLTCRLRFIPPSFSSLSIRPRTYILSVYIMYLFSYKYSF